MSIELTPIGTACSIACKYCYQEPMRLASGNKPTTYDMRAMFAALEREGVGKPDGRGNRTGFTVFGGEPLLTPVQDLERIFIYGFGASGGNGVQTNGALITDRHVELFKKWNVHVGFSLDGPGALNSARCAGTEEATAETTRKSLANLDRLLAERVSVSLIVTLHKLNAAPDCVDRLVEWLAGLHRKGLQSVRLHRLEIDTAAAVDLALSDSEVVDAYRRLFEFSSATPGCSIDVFRDLRQLLLGDDRQVTCIWNGCDAYSTDAVRGVDGDGTRRNCGRTNKDGVNWVKAEGQTYWRPLALLNTPQEHGGCQGCRFWYACSGECPGHGVDGDWRNKTDQCAVLMALFGMVEAQLVKEGYRPVSLDQPRRARIEQALIAAWMQGRQLGVYGADRGEQAAAASGHADVPHGDVPHFDDHGDHTDVARRPHGDVDRCR
jgi:uncharacterized protein